MKTALLAANVIAGLIVPASAMAQDYLDDRSDPAALVRSLYNAIDRGEFARAYSYFATPPADSVEAYAEGYAGTESIELVTGPASEEGAAGSVHYALPVAILAMQEDGEAQVYGGCYTLRLANPQIQAEDFTPLRIDDGELDPSEESLEEAMPESCGDGEAPEPRDPALVEAEEAFAATYGDSCTSLRSGADPAEAKPEIHEIAFNYPHDAEDAPRREATLFRFWCDRGAYNEFHVYFLAEDTGEVSPLGFATPELDIRYQQDDFEAPVEDIGIIGYTVQNRLVNSQFDPDTLTITANTRWRGLGDASSQGTWMFRSGTFTLVRYDVDASYDGEVNPETVLDYHSGP